MVNDSMRCDKMRDNHKVIPTLYKPAPRTADWELFRNTNSHGVLSMLILFCFQYSQQHLSMKFLFKKNGDVFITLISSLTDFMQY